MQTRAVCVEWCGLVLRQQLMVVTVSEKTTNDQTLQEFADKTKIGYRPIRLVKIWLLEENGLTN